MDTLFNIHRNPIPNQLHHHQSNSNSSSIHYFSHQSNSNSSTSIPKPCTKVPSKTTTFTTQKTSIPTFINTSQLKQPPSKPPSQSYQKAPTGYAVALLDAAQCHNVLDAVERDVARLSKWLRNEQLQGVMTNTCLEMKDKGDIVKEIVKKGKFHKHLLKLVNILVENTKVELLSQVLMEFGRIYDELIGSSNDQLVLLSSSVKMKENQVFKIAKRVQNLTGANKVIVRTKYCYMMNN